jgi:choline dehydrogenase-like flavoprotein
VTEAGPAKRKPVTGHLAATVVGGGIAGLALAVSLAQAGWQVTVLERAPAFSEVGAGLALTSNGMAALKAIEVDEAARTAGHEARTAGFQDPRGRWLPCQQSAQVIPILLAARSSQPSPPSQGHAARSLREPRHGGPGHGLAATGRMGKQSLARSRPGFRHGRP